MSRNKVILIVSIFFSFFISCQFLNSYKTNSNYKKYLELYEGKIISVIDGDTVKVQFNNSYKEFDEIETVRLIGVNTPELNLNKNKEPEYFSQEARDYTNQFYQKDVVLKLDSISAERDKYDRLLAYIYLKEDESLINYLIIKNGYGRYYDYFEFDYDLMELFAEAEADAEKNKKGIWNKE